MAGLQFHAIKTKKKVTVKEEAGIWDKIENSLVKIWICAVIHSRGKVFHPNL